MLTQNHIMQKLDSIYNSFWIGKAQQLILKKGKKQKAEIYLYTLFKKFKLEFGLHPYFLLIDYLIQNKIVVELRSFRRSSIFYDIPFPVEFPRQYLLGFRWVTTILRNKTQEIFRLHLHNEFSKFIVVKPGAFAKYNYDFLTAVTKSRAFQQYRW